MFMFQVSGVNKAEFAFDVTTEKTNIEISFLYYDRAKIGVDILHKTLGEESTFYIKRSIFQTFWKVHCCAISLFFELETSNLGSLLIFQFDLSVQNFRKIGQHLY